MALHKRVRPEYAGRRMATLLAQFGDLVQGLWMTTGPDVITFWLLTPPIETEAQLNLYERTAALYDELPEIKFEVRVLNPAWFASGDALSALPPEAHAIALPAA